MPPSDLAGWPRPTPLQASECRPFPVQAFPDSLAQYLVTLADETQTPPDLPGMLALAVLATCCGKRVVLEVRPNWREPLSLWLVVVLGSGNRKTAVLRRMTEPVTAYEREWLRSFAPSLAVERSRRRSLEATLHRLEQEIARSDGSPDPALEANRCRIAEKLETAPAPVAPRLLVEDITPESLASVLAEQGGRIALLSDEGGLFDIMAGRYSRHGIPNLDVYLKADSASDIRVDRKGRAAEFVDAATLTLGLAVQPEVIRNLSGQPGFAGRGLLARFLYSWPADTVGRRRVNVAPVSESVEATYRERVLRLLAGAEQVQKPGFQPAVLRVSRFGCRVLDEFAEEVEPQLEEHAPLGAIQGWGSKLTGKVARIAALLHVAECESLEHAVTGEVEALTVGRAVELGRYLIEHAKHVFAEMGADPIKREARQVLAWVASQRRERFSRRDAFSGLRAHFPTVDRLDGALRLLEEHDYLRAEQAPPRQGAGRPPSPTFAVSPHFLSQNSQNPQKRAFANSGDSAGNGLGRARGPAAP